MTANTPAATTANGGGSDYATAVTVTETASALMGISAAAVRASKAFSAMVMMRSAAPGSTSSYACNSAASGSGPSR